MYFNTKTLLIFLHFSSYFSGASLQYKNKSRSFIHGILSRYGNGSCLCSKSLELKTHKFENICMKVLERHLLDDVCLMSRDLEKVFFLCGNLPRVLIRSLH